jgi:FdhD protein
MERQATCERIVRRLTREGRKDREDTLVVERRYTLRLNGEEAAALMATPGDEEALGLGYLLGEGLLPDPETLQRIDIDEDRIDVTAERVDREAFGRLRSEAVMASGCGRAPSTLHLPEGFVLESDYRLPAETVFDAMEGFLEYCRLYRETGAVHTARLLLEDGRSFVAEDLAQHNTLDKVVGKALLAGADPSRSLLLLSGRLSSEMVAKAVTHRLPIVASRTAATCLGAQIGEKFGLTLLGFVREGRMNAYTHDWRVL